MASLCVNGNSERVNAVSQCSRVCLLHHSILLWRSCPLFLTALSSCYIPFLLKTGTARHLLHPVASLSHVSVCLCSVVNCLTCSLSHWSASRTKIQAGCCSVNAWHWSAQTHNLPAWIQGSSLLTRLTSSFCPISYWRRGQQCDSWTQNHVTCYYGFKNQHTLNQQASR